MKIKHTTTIRVKSSDFLNLLNIICFFIILCNLLTVVDLIDYQSFCKLTNYYQ